MEAGAGRAAGRAGGGAAGGLRGVGLGARGRDPGPAARLAGEPASPRVRLSPDTLSDVTRRKEMDTQAASKRGETVYQGGAGAVSTLLSTNIYKYLHHTACRRGFSGRPRCSGQPGRGRRGLAGNNKYHFLPARTAHFGTGGAPRGPRGRGAGSSGRPGTGGGRPRGRVAWAPGGRAHYLGQ